MLCWFAELCYLVAFGFAVGFILLCVLACGLVFGVRLFADVFLL